MNNEHRMQWHVLYPDNANIQPHRKCAVGSMYQSSVVTCISLSTYVGNVEEWRRVLSAIEKTDQLAGWCLYHDASVVHG